MEKSKIEKLKWPIRVTLHRTGIWKILSRCRLVLSYLLKRPHEQDFRYFRCFEGKSGLFIDVGANAGQSVVSFRIFNRSYKIISFEPNPFHEGDLKWLKKILPGEDFDYFMAGLSDGEGKERFYVPMIQGVPLTQEATFIKDSLLNHSLAVERMKGATGHVDFSIMEMDVPIGAFDSYHFKPDVIKIDVQTSELDVLKGMNQTLKSCRPILMVERGTTLPQIIEYLSPLGYRLFRYDEKKGNLVAFNPHFLCLNVFFIPEERIAKFGLSSV